MESSLEATDPSFNAPEYVEFTCDHCSLIFRLSWNDSDGPKCNECGERLRELKAEREWEPDEEK